MILSHGPGLISCHGRPMKYALYPGCAAQGATPELYQSTRAIIGQLGIEVVELTAAACCGAGVVTEAILIWRWRLTPGRLRKPRRLDWMS